MTDKEILENMLQRMIERQKNMGKKKIANVEHENGLLEVYDEGYFCFYSTFRFDDQGNLVSIGAWER